MYSEKEVRRKGGQREAEKFRFRSGELNSVNFAAEPNFPPTLSSRLSFPVHHSSLSRSFRDGRYGKPRATTLPQSFHFARTRMAKLLSPILVIIGRFLSLVFFSFFPFFIKKKYIIYVVIAFLMNLDSHFFFFPSFNDFFFCFYFCGYSLEAILKSNFQ